MATGGEDTPMAVETPPLTTAQGEKKRFEVKKVWQTVSEYIIVICLEF